MDSLAQQGEKGLSVTITPLSRKTHHILVDDMTAESLARLGADGYKPACVIESSPGNFQAVLNVPKFAPDDPKERDWGNRLARELNRAYGDKNLSGAEHAHRMPGFPNCKIKHRREDGTFPESVLLEAGGEICKKAEARLADIRHEHLRQMEQKKEVERHLSSLPGSSVEAYWNHYENILEYQGTPDDYSKLDSMIALRLKLTGHSRAAVQNALEICAPQARKQDFSETVYKEKYEGRNWRDYAKRTADYAFGGRAVEQESRLGKFFNTFLRIEGRAPERQARQEVPSIIKTAARAEPAGVAEWTSSAEGLKGGEGSVEGYAVPQVGKRVVFHFKDKESGDVLVGKVVGMDDAKGTVTIESSRVKYTVFCGKGYFTAARDIPREQTVEFALESARTLAGEGGKVYFAHKDGEYKGKILEVGPVYAAQRIGQKMLVLHRLKDFGETDVLQEGADVVVRRESGRSFGAANIPGVGPEKDSSIER
jgi:hypothetical protein